LTSRNADAGSTAALTLPGITIFLKLENLQPWGSFKIRPAVNAGGGNVVCIVSGGNIDAAKFGAIMNGQIPF
jgi:threonine dehydratase